MSKPEFYFKKENFHPCKQHTDTLKLTIFISRENVKIMNYFSVLSALTTMTKEKSYFIKTIVIYRRGIKRYYEKDLTQK